MARIRVLHWKESEAQPLLLALRAAGHQVDYQEKLLPGLMAAIRTAPTDAIVIDLSRLPAQGREIAVTCRGSKSLRHIPLVFVAGDPEKVQKIQDLLPDAAYTSLAGLTAALKRAIAAPPAAPVVPPQMMERMTGRPTAQKLGIVEGSRVALIDPPKDYIRVLGQLPKDVVLEEEPETTAPVTLWFVRDPQAYVEALPRRRSLAGKSRLWVVWPKGQRQGINQTLVRETALQLGLVDYKICSVNEVWTAMAFAVKKSPK